MKGKSGREDNYHVEEFYVPQDLFGLVIGIKGQNLQMTRKIEGVVHIILDDDHSKVRVVAEVCGRGPGLPCMVCCEVTVLCFLQTAQAAAKARDMLEYGSEEVRIPRDLAGIGGWSCGWVGSDMAFCFTLCGGVGWGVYGLCVHVVHTCVYVSVWCNDAAKVIGKKGQVIQDIMEKSGVVNVKILGDEEARDRQVDTTSEVRWLPWLWCIVRYQGLCNSVL